MPKFPEVAASLGETLDLPVPLPSGQVKTYKVPPVDGVTFLWLADTFTDLKITTRDATEDTEVVDDLAEDILYQRCLSLIYAQMLADKVSWDVIKVAGLTALAWHLHGESAALAVWTEGGFPKRSTSETTEETATPAEAPSTPTPASATGTTRSRKTASPGRPSSRAGRSSKPTSTSSTASTSDSPAS